MKVVFYASILAVSCYFSAGWSKEEKPAKEEEKKEEVEEAKPKKECGLYDFSCWEEQQKNNKGLYDFK